jgi:CrcB protein
MPLVLAVALGGAAGASSRYGLDTFVERHTESLFPWATFVINASGCLAVGFLISAVVDHRNAPDWIRAGLVVGFCGGYTTFSTFAQETLDLIEAGDLGVAMANVAASVILGTFAVFAGVRLGRLT